MTFDVDDLFNTTLVRAATTLGGQDLGDGKVRNDRARARADA